MDPIKFKESCLNDFSMHKAHKANQGKAWHGMAWYIVWYGKAKKCRHSAPYFNRTIFVYRIVVAIYLAGVYRIAVLVGGQLWRQTCGACLDLPPEPLHTPYSAPLSAPTKPPLQLHQTYKPTNHIA